MKVGVLNRAGIQAASTSKLAIADCDIHPRPAGVGIGGGSKSLYPYLSKRWGGHVAGFGTQICPPLGERVGLSERPASGLPAGRVFAGWAVSGQRSGVYGRAASGSE